AQCIVLIVAYLVPLAWLSYKVTGNLMPHATYGYVLKAVTAREAELLDDPREREVVSIYRARADAAAAKLADVGSALAADRAAAEQRQQALARDGAPLAQQQAAGRAVAALPRSEDEARRRYAADLAAA